jgi:sulfur-carrier protein
MVRVELPHHLRELARADREVVVNVPPPVTVAAVIDALEERFPQLQGTIRDHATGTRRPYLRFFACEADVSFLPPDAALPEAVARGIEPFMILGAISGG